MECYTNAYFETGEYQSTLATYSVDSARLDAFTEKIHNGTLLKNWGKIKDILSAFHECIKVHDFFSSSPGQGFAVMDKIIRRFLGRLAAIEAFEGRQEPPG